MTDLRLSRSAGRSERPSTAHHRQSHLWGGPPSEVNLWKSHLWGEVNLWVFHPPRGQPLKTQHMRSQPHLWKLSPISKKSAPQLRSQQPHSSPKVTNTIEEEEKGQQTIPPLRSSLWPTVIEIVEKKKGGPCAPIIGDLLNPEKSFLLQETLVKLPSTHRLWDVWSFSHEIYASP